MRNKFSIAMCTYNGTRHLREQLESFASQTRLPDELVICDDGSTDATSAIVADFAASVPFTVHFHVNETNLGLIKNFEQAIRLCTGDYIALSDQDDVWMPEKLALLEAEFLAASNVGLVFTDAELIDADGRVMNGTLWEKLPLRPEELKRLRSRRASDQLLEGSTVTGATMAFRVRFRDLVLPIPTDLPIIHDAWIAVLVASVDDVLPLSAPLIRYRQHSGQQIGAKARRTGGASVRKALQRNTSYIEIIEIGTQVHKRLMEHRDAYDSDEALESIEARLAHLHTRAQLRGKSIRRFKSVITELLTGRYHQFSNGLYSAGKDLVRRSPDGPKQ